MPRRLRLDAELVRRGLARSREHAHDLITQGRVTVSGSPATKAATGVTTEAAVVVAETPARPDYVSRGGHKLAGAIAQFGPTGLVVAGRAALDAGASTGGFTDVLLREGATRVTAVDVGYGQLAWTLRQDPRVTILDRTNVRELTRGLVADPPGVVVADLSFISLTLVLAPLVEVADTDADFVLMVKPQFEVGKGQLGKGGVVRNPQQRVAAVLSVASAAVIHGLGVRGVGASRLPGPAGNVEYFVWFQPGAPAVDPAQVEAVVREGPR
jgi:23S rRNA (cytidine1920-2'-O)/16S rRNA (cytidine1409-2'-O)-methyltransferase